MSSDREIVELDLAPGSGQKGVTLRSGKRYRITVRPSGDGGLGRIWARLLGERGEDLLDGVELELHLREGERRVVETGPKGIVDIADVPLGHYMAEVRGSPGIVVSLPAVPSDDDSPVDVALPVLGELHVCLVGEDRVTKVTNRTTLITDPSGGEHECSSDAKGIIRHRGPYGEYVLEVEDVPTPQTVHVGRTTGKFPSPLIVPGVAVFKDKVAQLLEDESLAYTSRQ